MCRSAGPKSFGQADVERFADPLVRETIERLLTKRHVDRHEVSLTKALRSPIGAAHRRMCQANLVGVGFGLKETNKRLTGDLAVRVYVSRKQEESKLSRGVRVPKQINGVPTDVVSVGRPVHQARPAELGTSISRAAGLPGTLACIVAKPDGTKWCLLSAAHVLAPDDAAAVGDDILEPAAGTPGASLIADLADYEPLMLEGTNTMDAAIAVLVRKSDVTNVMPKIGAINPTVGQPALYQSVRKFGAATGHTVGMLTSVSTQIRIRSLLTGDDYLYDQVLEVRGQDTDFTQGGDSGALVVDAVTSQPIGLVIGGKAKRTFVTPIDRVLNRFSVSIIGS